MTDTTPDADELQLRTRLQQLVDGPAARPPAMPPGPPPRGYRSAERPRDWLDDFLDSTTTPSAPREADPAEEPPAKPSKPKAGPAPIAAAKPKKRKKRKKKPGPDTPRTAWDTQPSDPRQSLLDAFDRIPYRIRWLILHATAAAAGYKIGWVDYSTRTAAWIADHGLINVSSLFWCAVAISCEVLRHRMSNTRLVVRWLTAVPIASIVTGTLLYGTGWNHLELPL